MNRKLFALGLFFFLFLVMLVACNHKDSPVSATGSGIITAKDLEPTPTSGPQSIVIGPGCNSFETILPSPSSVSQITFKEQDYSFFLPLTTNLSTVQISFCLATNQGGENENLYFNGFGPKDAANCDVGACAAGTAFNAVGEALLGTNYISLVDDVKPGSSTLPGGFAFQVVVNYIGQPAPSPTQTAQPSPCGLGLSPTCTQPPSSPTATPDVTPTITPTISLTATPTSIVDPTPTPSPTSSLSATMTPSGTPSASPTTTEETQTPTPSVSTTPDPTGTAGPTSTPTCPDSNYSLTLVHYEQDHQSAWDTDRLGGSTNPKETIGLRGCQLCCLAMLSGIPPNLLNYDLTNSTPNGILPTGDLLDANAASYLHWTYKNEVGPNEIESSLDAGYYVIAHVPSGSAAGHFVVITGVERDASGVCHYTIQDPNYETNRYKYLDQFGAPLDIRRFKP